MHGHFRKYVPRTSSKNPIYKSMILEKKKFVLVAKYLTISSPPPSNTARFKKTLLLRGRNAFSDRPVLLARRAYVHVCAKERNVRVCVCSELKQRTYGQVLKYCASTTVLHSKQKFSFSLINDTKELPAHKHVCLQWSVPSQPILVSLGAHSLSVATLVVVSDGRGRHLGCSKVFTSLI